MKMLAFACACALLFCGCMNSRYSGRYEDGTAYRGIGGVKTFRKFYIRSFSVPDGYGAKVSAAKIQEMIPELLHRHARAGDVPIDVTIRPGKIETSGGWTKVFAMLGGIFPLATTADQDVAVDISIDGMEDSRSAVICHFTYDMKMTVLSPLAAISYSPKDGCQENLMMSGIVTIPDVSEVFSGTIARGIAVRLRQSALERLTLPDIDFGTGKEGL